MLETHFVVDEQHNYRMFLNLKLDASVGCKCGEEEWASYTGCTEAKQGSTGKKRCESTCGWNCTWLGMLYRHFSNSRLSLEGGRGMPALREGDRFLVDLVEAYEVEMMREGCRAAEVWRVSELRSLDGTRLTP